MMALQAIKYDGIHLLILDQLQLPHLVKYVPVRTAKEGWHAIREMRVRGAPAIAIVAILSLAVELHTLLADDKLSPIADEVRVFITEKLQYLLTSRPTAVNLGDAAHKFEHLVAVHARDKDSTGHSVAMAFFKEAEQMLTDDLHDNQKIGAYGARWIVEKALLPGRVTVNVLTHCNTG
jgi:methylthioribose-1-phosphate isomerase